MIRRELKIQKLLNKPKVMIHNLIKEEDDNLLILEEIKRKDI